MPNAKNTTVGPAQVGQLASCACFNLRKAARTVTQLYDDALRPSGVRATQLPLLAVLRGRAATTVNELAEATAIDRTTLTRSLRPLERDGLIRSRPGGDRRTRELLLTAKGKRQIEKAYPLWLAVHRQVRRRLGAAAMDELVASTRLVVNGLKGE